MKTGELGSSRYSLRHGGASDDLLNQRRSLLEIKRRGLWKSEISLRRYAKEGMILSELRKVPPETVAYGRQILNHLLDLLVGTMPVPRPPYLPPKRAM